MLAVLLSAILQVDPPGLNYTEALEPAVRAAKSLKCGMWRRDVKAAFANVKAPDAVEKDERGVETLRWDDVTTLGEDGRSCDVRVTLRAIFQDVQDVTVVCRSLSAPDHWGERERDFEVHYELDCRKKPKK